MPCNDCFIAGTLVLTSIGNKNIEDIEVGDEVWAFDEATGEKALKKVIQLFRNTTDKWTHLLFKNNETKVVEELVCTPGHPFYVDNLGWIEADKLLENDEVLLYNSSKVTLVNKEIEILDTPENIYNFEVEDYHTYYVGNNGILCHNVCVAKEGKFRADVRKGGEPNYRVGHAHIYEGSKNIASVSKDGSVLAEKLSKGASDFVKNHLDEIAEGIEKFYYIGR